MRKVAILRNVNNKMPTKKPTSPVRAKKFIETGPVDFPEAIRAVIKGGSIRRESWDDPTAHGLLKDGYLMIIIKGEEHTWTITEADMIEEDWIVKEELPE